METIGVVLLVVIAAMLSYLLVFKTKQPSSDSTSLIKADLTNLSEQLEKLREGVRTQLEIQLDKNQQSMAKQLQQSSNIVREVTERLTKLDDTNKRVVDVAEELRSLQHVLQNPKQRGVLGEFYLDQILQNHLPPGSYATQYKLGEGLVVDAIIFLDGKTLPIDSKFSLENYNRLIEAKGAAREVLEKQFKEDLKKRIDETSKYIQPKKGTLEQALMFIPSEAIYYDLLANKVGASGVNGRNLMQYAAVDKRVMIVGPSTLSAMLQVIVQGLRTLEIQKDTEVIRKNVEQLGKHLVAYDGYFKKLGSSLGATVGHYNAAYKELGKIDKDVVKIADKALDVDPLLLEKPRLEDD